MDFEKQVCSRDLSKRLEELGVKQESVCWWSERYQLDEPNKKTFGVRFNANPDFSGTPYSFHYERDVCAAFTVAELGEMLPKNRVIFSFSGFKEGSWACELSTAGEKEHREYAETEADARAKMLIYLLENKIITV